MAFGYPDEIFRYPTVQYIPLKMYKVHQFKHKSNSKNINFRVYPPARKDELNRNISRQYKNKYPIDEDRLAILVKNNEIDIVKYRGHEVILVGFNTPGFYHLFQIKSEYFYKKKLTFALYNGDTADRIAIRHYRTG